MCQTFLLIQTKMKAYPAGDRGQLILEMGGMFWESQICVLILTKMKAYPASDRG